MIDISLQIYFDLCTLLGGLVSLIMKDLFDFIALGEKLGYSGADLENYAEKRYREYVTEEEKKKMMKKRERKMMRSGSLDSLIED